jgi:hypothetical protein
MSAPHLPPPSCSIPLHRRLEYIPMILLFTALALISSFAVSLLVVSRFSFSPVSETRVVIAGNAVSENRVLDPSVLRDVKEKTVMLVDTTKKSFGGYPVDSFLGQAALLSTDGWAVTTAAFPVGIASVRAVDVQGVVYSISEQKIDASSGLRYVKIQGEGFRIFDVSRDTPIETQTLPVFSFGHVETLPLLLSEKKSSPRSSFTFAQSRMVLSVEPTVQSSRVLVNDRGVLVALVGEGGVVVPGFVVQYGLPLILSGAPLAPNVLPYTFTAINGFDRGGRFIQHEGLIVARIQPKQNMEVLRVGDIITRIDNTPATEAVLYTLLYDSRESVTMTVLRNDVEIDVVVPFRM